MFLQLSLDNGRPNTEVVEPKREKIWLFKNKLENLQKVSSDKDYIFDWFIVHFYSI